MASSNDSAVKWYLTLIECVDVKVVIETGGNIGETSFALAGRRARNAEPVEPSTALLLSRRSINIQCYVVQCFLVSNTNTHNIFPQVAFVACNVIRLLQAKARWLGSLLMHTSLRDACTVIFAQLDTSSSSMRMCPVAWPTKRHLLHGKCR